MATIARSPGACCIKTVEHVGIARGAVEKIAGVDTYVTRPANLGESRRIILFFADVFGPFYLNSQLIIDYWASHGYLVVALGYFEGDPVENYLHKLDQGYSIDNDFVPSKLNRAKQITPPWIEAVRAQFGTSDTKWVTVGVDHTFPLEFRRRAEDILIEIKATFALRGNLDDPVTKWAKGQSAETIMSWFDMFCTKAEQSRLVL